MAFVTKRRAWIAPSARNAPPERAHAPARRARHPRAAPGPIPGLGTLVRRLLALAGVILMFAAPACAQRLLEDSKLLPVLIDGKLHFLESYSARLADANGALPLAILTHGGASDPVDNAVVHASNLRQIARDLARRGWHAVSIVRRGFGVSEGKVPALAPCGPDLGFKTSLEEASKDIEAAVVALAADKQVDAGRVLVIGHASGGAVALMAAARIKAGMRLAISFSGGIMSQRCPWEEQAVAAFRDLGQLAAKNGNPPTQWFYAEGEPSFGPDIGRRLREAYAGAGGKAEITVLPTLGDDQQALFTANRGRERWLPEADRFLAAQNLPALTPERIDAILAKLAIPAPSLDRARRYLALPGEKALAMPANGQMLYWNFAHAHRESASKAALQQCEQKETGCRLVLVNHVPPEPGPAGADAAR